MIEKIGDFDWKKIKEIRDGCYMKDVPKPSTENLQMLQEKINEIIDYLNNLRINTGGPLE